MPFCDVTLNAEKSLNNAFPDKLVTIGDHIKKKRLEQKLTQFEAAQLIGVKECTVWNRENNHSQLWFIAFLKFYNFWDILHLNQLKIKFKIKLNLFVKSVVYAKENLQIF